MKIEKKLDKIITILFDENLLHWKKIPSTDFLSEFASKKYNINWNDAEIGLVLTILENGGYIVLNKTSVDSCKTPSYSLTPKGILIKRTGGFVFKKLIERIKNFLIISASFVTIIVGIATSVDFYYNHLHPSHSITNPTNQTKNNENEKSSPPNTQRNVEIYK